MRNAASPSRSVPWVHRSWLRRLLYAVVAIGLLLSLLPIGIHHGLEIAMQRLGASRAEVADVDLNLFTARLALRGLRLQMPGQRAATLKELQVRWRWRPLFERQVWIASLSLTGLDTEIAQGADRHWLVAGVSPMVGGLRPEQAQPSSWGFALTGVEVKQSRIGLRLRGETLDLELDDLRIGDLVSWRPDTSGQARFQGRLNGSPLVVAGSLQPYATQANSDFHLNLEGLPLSPLGTIAGIAGLAGQLALDLDVHLDSSPPAKGTSAAGREASIRAKGKIAIKALRLPAKGEQPPFAVDSVAWSGELDLRSAEAGKPSLRGRGALKAAGISAPLGGKADALVALKSATLDGDIESRLLDAGPVVRHDGTLSATGLHWPLDDAGGALALGQAAWQGKLQLRPAPDQSAATRQAVELNGTLKLAKLATNGIDAKFDLAQVEWQGEAAANWLAGALAGYRAQGQLRLDDNRVVLPAKALRFGADSASWQGEVRAEQDLADPRFEGQLGLDQFVVTRTDNGLRLASFGSLQIDGLAGNPRVLTARSLTASDGLALQPIAEKKPAPAVLEGVKTLRASGIRVALGDEPGVEAVELRLTDAQAYLGLLPDKSVFGARELMAVAPSTDGRRPNPTADDEAGAGTRPVRVKLGLLAVDGESVVRFEDQSVKPVFNARLQLDRFEVSDIDSGAKDRQSPFAIKARVNEFGRVELTGQALLGARRPTLSFAGTAKGLDVPPLSSYVTPAIGYRLTKGQLGGRVELTISDGALDGNLKLKLKNLGVIPIRNKTRQRTTSLLGTPLKRALDLLRDSNNNIKLDLPIRGDLDNPRFDFTDTLNRAIVGSVKSAALTYAKFAVPPIGALMTLLDLTKKATTLRVQPVAFQPGSDREPAIDLDNYLTELAKAARQRPELRFRLCGFAVAADVQVLGEADEGDLAKIAERRAELVKRRLVRDQDLDVERLFVCEPAVEPRDQGAPRTEVLVDR